MPRLNISQALTANQQLEVIGAAGWQYQYVPWPAKVVLCLRATTINVRQSLNAGALTLLQDSILPGGGTAGNTPTAFNSPIVEEEVAAGDRLSLVLRETAGAVATVDGFIDLIPL